MTARALMQQALEALELLTQSTTEAALDYADNAIDALRERLAQPVQEPVAHTTGHCENHKQKGGCQLHNLQCGWPDCDRKPITTSLQSRSEQAQWDAIPDAFNEWWDADYDDTGNPYRKDSPAYWAWSGWKAASKQPEQEPVALEAAPLSDYSKADGDFYKWWYSHMQNDLMQPPLNEVGYRVARYIWDAALRERLAQPEQPAQQEPVARVIDNGTPEGATEWIPFTNRVEPLKTGDLLYTAPPQRKPLTDEECDDLWAAQLFDIDDKFSAREFIRDVEDAHDIKENT